MTEVNRQAKPDMRPRCGAAVIELTFNTATALKRVRKLASVGRCLETIEDRAGLVSNLSLGTYQVTWQFLSRA